LPAGARTDHGWAPIKEESIGEDGDGEEVTLTINVARQRIKLKARSVWDLEEHKFEKVLPVEPLHGKSTRTLTFESICQHIRSEILQQHTAKGFRTRDIDQFYLKGKYILESLTIQELMSKDHQPSLDPAVDILHAVERGSVMSESQNPPPVVPQRHASASKLETGARVRVHSLQSAKSQKYNGKEGVLGDRHEDKLRWYVHLSNGVSISCKPDNLEFIRAAEKKPQQSDSGSSGEEAVKRKVKQYSGILMHVAFASATQGQAILGSAGSIVGALTTQIMLMVNKWERAGKSAHRKAIATALKRILEGVSDIERLRPHHPPWTKLEEACVKKVFEYKCMPYTDLMHKAGDRSARETADDFASSSDEHSRVDSDDGSDEETNAGRRPRPNWEQLFLKYKKFWRRLASIAALGTADGDALMELEHQHFKDVIDDLESHGWEIRKPIERILLKGVRVLQLAAFDSDANSKKQIEKLLKWVQKEEQKVAGSGDKDLFRVDEAGIEISEGEEAAQVVRKYDRVCQLLAWLALEAKSQSRESLRRTAVDKLGPYLQERNISILNVAENLWALADSDGGLNLECLGSHTQQVGENPPPRPRASAAAKTAAKAAQAAKKDDAEVLTVSFKGSHVRDSGRVEVLEETNLGDGNETEDVGGGDGDDGAALVATSSEDAITRALTRRLHEYLRAGTNGIASKRAVYNSAALTHLATQIHDYDPEILHAGEYTDCYKST
jgi:hypothetical protein